MDEGHTRPAWPPHSYDNIYFIQRRYESVELSSQNLYQTRLPPTLVHKGDFPYEYILAHAITCCDMHVHAVLSSQEESILSMTEERMSRCAHRPDV